MKTKIVMDRSKFESSLLDPITFWKGKPKEEVRDLMGDDVAKMVQYDQKNPHHVYDLFTHTLYVVAGIPHSSPTSLRIAAFFHDIGKPDVAHEKHGRLVFYGHAAYSAEIAGRILEQLTYSEDEIQEICFYIRYHDAFISWVLPSEKPSSPYQKVISKENVRKEMKKIMDEDPVFKQGRAEGIWKNLMDLIKADIGAQANQVYREGLLIDTKEHKLQKLALISKYIKGVYENE